MTEPSEAATTAEPALRVVLADDHAMLRNGLARSLAEHGIEIVGEAGDGASAVELARGLQPDVVLMDVTMPVLDGVEATRRLHQEQPAMAVVMLTMHDDHDVLARAVAAGAAGYLVKDCSIAELVSTLRQVAGGQAALSPGLARAMLDEAAAEPSERILSDREAEVLQCFADGLSLPEVAAALFISVKTVKNHLASAYARLDARDRTQAVLAAVRMGIVRLD